LAKRSLFWRKEARFGEKKLVLAKRSPIWRKEACFSEKKPDLAKKRFQKRAGKAQQAVLAKNRNRIVN